MVTYANIGKFPFVYSSVYQTYTVSNVNIDIPVTKQESSWLYGSSGIMDQADRIFTSKMISIQHYHGNIKHSNHGNGSTPNKVFKKHRGNDNLPTLLLSMEDVITFIILIL